MPFERGCVVSISLSTKQEHRVRDWLRGFYESLSDARKKSRRGAYRIFDLFFYLFFGLASVFDDLPCVSIDQEE